MPSIMPSTRLSVLMYSNLFPTPVDPSFAIFNQQLAQELAQVCNLTIVCPLPWFPRWKSLRRFERWHAMGQIPTEYELAGLKVFSPKYPMVPRLSGGKQAALMYYGSRRLVARLHRERKFDVINALWLYPDAVAAERIGRDLCIPMVPAALGCDVNRMLGESDKRGQILDMLQRSRSVITVSDALRQRLVDEGVSPEGIVSIGNGVNSALFHVRDKSAERAHLGLPAARRTVVFVGRLSEEKGVDTLVSATAELKRMRDDFHICLVGEGECRGSIEAAVAAKGLGDVLRLVGKQPHAEIANWIGAADVFCLPSYREGCPNVVIEALGSGRPVVASAVGGIPDMVSPSSGILIPPREPALLAAALNEALSREWDDTAIAASVAENTWAGAAARYRSAYQRALAV